MNYFLAAIATLVPFFAGYVYGFKRGFERCKRGFAYDLEHLREAQPLIISMGNRHVYCITLARGVWMRGTYTGSVKALKATLKACDNTALIRTDLHGKELADCITRKFQESWADFEDIWTGEHTFR